VGAHTETLTSATSSSSTNGHTFAEPSKSPAK
jgi:hypothetical protein